MKVTYDENLAYSFSAYEYEWYFFVCFEKTTADSNEEYEREYNSKVWSAIFSGR